MHTERMWSRPQIYSQLNLTSTVLTRRQSATNQLPHGRASNFRSWPKAAVMGIRPGRQLSGDKRPTRPGLDNAIGVRRGTASKTPFRCRARAGRLKIAGENRWCRRGTNVTNEEEVGGAIAHGNPVGATSAENPGRRFACLGRRPCRPVRISPHRCRRHGRRPRDRQRVRARCGRLITLPLTTFGVARP